ncbi:hypothetical protein KWL13_011295 [Clostridioides difficile]|nr:hypothetical protein [Clostridioides difficile]EKG0783678.1 hypothetical protein [Clostridioides difficile]EKS6760475.1 hypothetical protein [Clostridioides difficile]MBG0292565.1 hypothetical protein [Clostridioides difficile]MBH7463388.1 hypothetical protein [Clostridioides difficile]
MLMEALANGINKTKEAEE